MPPQDRVFTALLNSQRFARLTLRRELPGAEARAEYVEQPT